MTFKVLGNPENPTILFFHAMGVTGTSSIKVAEHLKDRYFCVLPTSSVYCVKQKYVSKEDEINQIVGYLREKGVSKIALLVCSSLGADLGLSFLVHSGFVVEHSFFDGRQFAQIKKGTRRIMVPFLYLAIKSLYWSKGATLKKILWCDSEEIKPYFIEAGKNLKYRNLKKQMMDSLIDKAFPKLSHEVQKSIFFEFGSIEEHFKYRESVKKAYPNANFPIFDNCNHMQIQILRPKEFSSILDSIVCTGGFSLPKETGRE